MVVQSSGPGEKWGVTAKEFGVSWCSRYVVILIVMVEPLREYHKNNRIVDG